jgi:sugar phosphate isomerase/epimerase
MRKLLSISDDPWSVQRLGGPETVAAAVAENGFDGVELMRWHDPQPVPGARIIGRHMPYWPTWLDFMRGDEQELRRQFDNADNARQYYGASSWDDFVKQRRTELEETAAMGAEYAVFHISHSELEHCYTGGFTYSDEEIIRAFIEFINDATDGLDGDVALLFENHWFPGLKLTDRKMAEALMKEVRYPYKGFVLDISHMMLTAGAKTEPEAVDAILKNIEGLGDMAAHIHAIHMNSAAGAQPLVMDYHGEAPYETRLTEAFRYVGSMDPHKPFTHHGIIRVLEAVAPEYLVYELSFGTQTELENAVKMQDAALTIR